MKVDELRQKSIEELRSSLSKQRADFEKLMLDIIQKKEKNSAKAKTVRADIARTNTVITEKKIVSQEEKTEEGRK